ncbi:MAG TPA: twin-arginine translocase subunit TatC [Gemmatimonadaceae bacterium]|nr:twin-arginine translocase subunit TatC [Gemmatimonadaceae bacterium]
MPFLDHLEELRWRILKSLLAIAIAFVFTFWLTTVSGLDVIGIATKPIEPYLHGKHLVFTGPIDPFTILLQAAGVLAVVLAFPVVGYQVWAFLAPALSKKERKVLMPVLFAATILFLAGIAMSVFVFVPVTMGLMDKLPHASIDAMLTVSEYFGFLFAVSLAFGAMFELPIVILALTAIGLVTPQFLTKYRRHAIVGTLIICEIVTPGDFVISTLMLWIPVYGLYELSIIVSRFVYKARLKREREAELAGDVTG